MENAVGVALQAVSECPRSARLVLFIQIYTFAQTQTIILIQQYSYTHILQYILIYLNTYKKRDEGYGIRDKK